MKNVRYSLKKYLTCFLLVSFVFGPLGVSADHSNLHTLETLRSEVESLERTINFSLNISDSDRATLEQIIDRIQDEIAILTVIETSGVAVEVIIDSVSSARVEVVTDGAVESMLINFDSSFATATEAELVAEAVSQTAAALNLTESTLTAGTAVVSTFSGIQAPVFVSTVPAEVVDLTPDSVVVGEQAGRTNVESILISGSVPDYEILAQVVYGPEGSFDRATVTKRFTFTRPSSADTLTAQLRDLVLKGQARTAEEFGINTNTVRSMGVISIERYETADDVPGLPLIGFSPSVGTVDDIAASMEDSPVTYFGSYSVIEEVAVQTEDVLTANRGKSFFVRFTSDQDEVLSFSLAPEWRRSGSDDDWSRTGRLVYGFTYSIHGVVLERVTEGGVTYAQFVEYLEEYFEDIGGEFGIDDETLVAELSQFLARNEAEFSVLTGSARYATWTPEEASACYAEREKDILKAVITYMLDGMQFSDEIDNISYIFPSVDVQIDSDRSSYTVSKRCENVGGSYFPSLP